MSPWLVHGSTWWWVCYGKFPFNFKVFRSVLALSVAVVSALSARRLAWLPRFVCVLAVCGGQAVSEWFRMEACILRFKRQRRSNLGFFHSICGLFSGWQRGLYHCIVCSSLGDEGCAASCKPCILCQTSWTVKVALNKVPQHLMLLAITKIVSLNLPGKKHISGAGMPVIAVATIIKKKHFLAHLMLFFNVQWGIFNNCHKL